MSDAAKQEVVEEPAPPAYAMPTIHLNDHVLWYDNGDLGSEGHPAVVVRVHAEQVDVKILGVGATQTYRSGVRHVTDPKLKQNSFIRESGGWDYSAATRSLVDAGVRIAALEARLVQLEQRLEQVGLGSEPPKDKKKAS